MVNPYHGDTFYPSSDPKAIILSTFDKINLSETFTENFGEKFEEGMVVFLSFVFCLLRYSAGSFDVYA